VTKNLSLFPFNNRANIATSVDGWYVDAGVVVNTLAGNDIISGIGGTSNTDINNGIANKVSISNNGIIITGTGNDSIYGISDGIGVYNTGTINTGTGNDNITGISTGSGLSSSKTSIFNIGIFNDEFTIDTGTGNDIISGTGNFGIYNTGTINTGTGKDNITGIGNVVGLDNVGTINTGEGNDLVNALKGGFGGNGNTFLGGNNDTLKGFGTGSFYGGTGIDKILFGQGTYTVSGTTIVSDGVTMNVNEFETIGGANGGLFTFKDGTLTVDAAGVGTLAVFVN
jgi:hypothetical protein